MGVRVIDIGGQTEVEVSPDEAQRGWLSGKYSIPEDRVAVKKGNQTGYVDTSNLADVLGGGWAVSDEDEKRQLDIQREESGIASQAIGAAEATASGLTFGVSRLAERALGVDPERMKARDEAIGGVGTALEVGAGLAGALVPVGLLGKGAAGLAARAITAPVRGVARAGEASAAALTRMVGSTATSTAGKVAQKVIPIAGRESLEGFVYGVGQEIDESVLGERELAAERLLGAGFNSALIGAAGGTALAGLGKIAHGTGRIAAAKSKALLEATTGSAASSSAPKMLSEALAKVARFSGAGDDAVEAIRSTGGRLTTKEGQIAQEAAFENVQGVQRRMTEETTELLSKQRELSLRIKAETMGKAKIRKQYAQMPTDAKYKAVPASMDEVANMQQSLASLRTRNAEASHSSYLEGSLRDFEDRLARAKYEIESAKMDPGETYAALDSLKRDWDIELRKLRESAGRTGLSQVSKTVDELTKIASGNRKFLVREDMWGQAGKMQGELNDLWSRRMSFVDNKKDVVAKIVNGEAEVDPNLVLKLIRDQGKLGGKKTATQLDNVLDADSEYFEALQKYFDLDEETSSAISELVAHRKHIGETLAKRAEIAAAADDIQIIRGVEGGGSPSITMASTAGTATGAAIGGLFGGPVGALVGGALGYATRPYTVLRALTGIMGMVEKVKGRTDGAVAKFLERGGKAATRSLERSRAAIPPAAGQIGAMTQREKDERREKVRAALAEYKTPERLVDKIGTEMADVSRAAPMLSSVASRKAATAVSYLTQHMPIHYKPSPFSNKTIVNPEEEARFDRIIDIFEDPTVALDRFADGSITKDDADALKAMWPAVYQGVQESIMEEVGRRMQTDEPLSYDQRMSMWVLFDVQTDESQSPGAVVASQMAHAADQQQQQQAQQAAKPQGRPSGAKESKMAERSSTGTQWDSRPLGERYG